MVLSTLASISGIFGTLLLFFSLSGTFVYRIRLMKLNVGSSAQKYLVMYFSREGVSLSYTMASLFSMGVLFCNSILIFYWPIGGLAHNSFKASLLTFMRIAPIYYLFSTRFTKSYTVTLSRHGLLNPIVSWTRNISANMGVLKGVSDQGLTLALMLRTRDSILPVSVHPLLIHPPFFVTPPDHLTSFGSLGIPRMM